MVVRNLHDARDRDLVHRLGDGDEDAFRDLLRRYGGAARALATRVIRQPFLAEEIVQEAFLALWRRPEAYRADRGSVRGFLLATVHHRAVDHVRREEAQRRRAEEADQSMTIVADIAEAVAEADGLAQDRQKVRAALSELPEEQLRVLQMMYYGGKSQSMIAEELALPLGTVKSRTLLGMRRLRAAIGETNGEGSA